MKTVKRVQPAPQMALGTRTAADLMTTNPMSIRLSATVAGAAAFLACRGISAAPVIDEAGRPVGVVSRTDILIRGAQRPLFHHDDSRVEATSCGTVRDIMTPVVFCVGPETSAARVVEQMLALKVRRLFVVDADGILTGVISTFDVLRKLRRWGSNGNAHGSG